MVGVLSNNDFEVSKLCYLFMGAIQPTKGEVYIDNIDINKVQANDCHGLIAYVSNAEKLFNATILENITMFDISKNTTALDTAALLNLDEDINDFPLGFDTLVDATSSKVLPSGLVARINLARVLVLRPRILILRDIYTGMDERSRSIFNELLAKLKGKCTIVLIANNIKDLSETTKIYKLEKGKLSEAIVPKLEQLS